MARFKRPVRTPVEVKATKQTFGERLKDFMDDWGRLVVPLGLIGILAGARFLGLLDDPGLGFSISILYILAVCGAFGLIVWQNPFPLWARVATVISGILVALGAVLPLVQMIYPGEPAFSEVVGAEKREVQLDPALSGFHHLEVYAASLAERPFAAGVEGRYHLRLAGKDIEGRFADVMRSVRAGRRGTRTVEQKHLMDVYSVTLPEGEKRLEVIRVDQAIGPDLRVALYPALVPPLLGYVLLGLAFLVGLVLDARFPAQTEKWRLAPWPAMVLAFIAIFSSAYERGAVTNAAVWSTIFGAAIGFTLGWVLSLLARRVYARVRI